MTLIISVSAIRLIVSVATIDLINSLSFLGNLDVLVYSPSKNIKFHYLFMTYSRLAQTAKTLKTIGSLAP